MRFKQYLEEMSNSECRATFEKWFMGETRKKPEEDTETESRLSGVLEKFFRDGQTFSQPKVLKFAKMLKDCRDVYKEELVPKVSYAYRAIPYKAGYHSDVFNNLDYKLEKIGNRLWAKATGFKYKSTGVISSWSNNFEAARNFYEGAFDQDDSFVIIKAKVNDDFIFSAAFTNEVKESSWWGKKMKDEDEIIKLSNKPQSTTVYVLPKFLPKTAKVTK